MEKIKYVFFVAALFGIIFFASACSCGGQSPNGNNGTATSQNYAGSIATGTPTHTLTIAAPIYLAPMLEEAGNRLNANLYESGETLYLDLILYASDNIESHVATQSTLLAAGQGPDIFLVRHIIQCVH